MEIVQSSTKMNLLKSRKRLQVCIKAEDMLARKMKILHRRKKIMLKEAIGLEQAVMLLRKIAEEERNSAGPSPEIFAAGSISTDAADKAERSLTEKEAELSELNERINAIKKEINICNRRAAVFNHVLIPRAKASIKRISAALEEKERALCFGVNNEFISKSTCVDSTQVDFEKDWTHL